MSVMRQVWLTVVFTAVSLPSYSQFLPDLQAKTPEEYDAYLDVIDGPVLEKGAAFERDFPSSALRLPVCELLAREWRSRGDAVQAIAADERGLAIAPDYFPLLVDVADLLANGTDRLDRAESAAQRALTLLETIKAPRRISIEEWTAAISKLRSRSHGALGMIRFKRDDVAGAVREFEAGLADASVDDPLLHYRLGRVYGVTGRTADARHQLEEAARTGDKTVRERANAALAALPRQH
jgi:tetratricopeptide (TPR) repeat protein